MNLKKMTILKIIFFFLFFIELIFNTDNNTDVSVKNKSYLTPFLELKNDHYKLERNFIKSGFNRNTKDILSSVFSIGDSNLEYSCEISSEYIGTGCKILVSDVDETKEYKMVVYGDVNGDGDRTITDMVQIMMYSKDSNYFNEECYRMAADVNQNHSVDITDASELMRALVDEREIVVKDSDDTNPSIETIITLSTNNISVDKGNTSKIIATTNKSEVLIESFKSTNEQIAKVDSSGLVTGLSGGSAKIIVTASDGTIAYVNVLVSVPVTGINLSQSVISMKNFEKRSLVVTVSPSDATDRSVVWSSSNEKVAIVDQNGIITAKGEGIAIITVKAKNGIGAMATVSVNNSEILVDEVKLDKNSATINVGDSIKLNASVLPSDATNKTITWSSSDPNVATVDENGNVRGISGGTAIISAISVSGVVARSSITVNIPAQDIKLSSTNISLDIGSSTVLTAEILPENVTDHSITWTSSNETVATVDQSGKAIGVGIGVAIIKAQMKNGIFATATVTVSQLPLGIVLNMNQGTIGVGNFVLLTATITPSNANDKSVSWSSSDPNVATVDQSGKVVGINTGSTVITATTKNGISASCIVIVEQFVTDIQLNKNLLQINLGSNYNKLMATISPSNATDSSINWSIKDSNIATIYRTEVVDGKSEVTIIGNKEGTTSIVAETNNGIKAEATLQVVNLSTTVDFSKMESCNENESVFSLDGVDLHECVKDFSFRINNKLKGFQNFAITDDYIYFSYPASGSVSETFYKNNGEDKTLQAVSENHVLQISKTNGIIKTMYLKYAGHGQAFDAGITDRNLYLNAFPHLYLRKRKNDSVYAAHSSGVAVATFTGESSEQEILRYPPFAIWINSDSKTLKKIRKADYDVTKDDTIYYNKIKELSSLSSRLENSYFAIDDENNRIISITKDSVGFVYNLDEFNKGKTVEPEYQLNGVSGSQGVDLYGDYLYIWNGATHGSFKISKYNIKTGKKLKEVVFDSTDLEKYYMKRDYDSWEAEGISLYKGKVYVGAMIRKCSTENCSSNKKYFDIFMITGI